MYKRVGICICILYADCIVFFYDTIQQNVITLWGDCGAQCNAIIYSADGFMW